MSKYSCLPVLLIKLRSGHLGRWLCFCNRRGNIVITMRGQVRLLQLVVLVGVPIVQCVGVLVRHDNFMGRRRPVRSASLVKQVLVDEVMHLVPYVIPGSVGDCSKFANILLACFRSKEDIGKLK